MENGNRERIEVEEEGGGGGRARHIGKQSQNEWIPPSNLILSSTPSPIYFLPY